MTSKFSAAPQLGFRKPVSLPDQVYETLRHAIVVADLLPGEKLVELEIASEMGMSQGPVREALQRLERDGLVERRARSATYVTQISINEMYELFYIRSEIEGFAARRTAQRISEEQCQLLDELIENMEKAGHQGEIATLAEYDMQLHRCVVEWSGSANFTRIWTPLSNQIQRFIVMTHPEYYPNYVEIGTRHQPIVDALRQHDSEAAACAVQAHIMLIWNQIQP